MTSSQKDLGLQLLPQPRHLETTGGTAPPGTAVATRRASGLPPQGYTLEISPSGITVEFADAAAERYGLATLQQIRAQCGKALPGLRIRDWPDFPVRGYMLDISRDRVPTRATLERIVDLLELLRINHFQLYTEHTFSYVAHPSVWRNASPMTPADVQWLDGICAAKGIELVANQNGFGHMERWLRHDEYRHFAEAPGGWTTSWGEQWQAGVLHPDDTSRDFVLDLYRELLSCFSSKRININFDETFELGKGRSKTRVETVGRGRVYLDFLLPIVEELHRRGAEVLFWGDVIRHHPELVSELPDHDLVALVWHYEAPVANPKLPEGLEEILAEVGIDEEVLRGFAGQVPVFSRSGMPFWVCPGTSSWSSLLGRWSNARANLLDAAAVGAAHGAGGYLITDWGDNGHMQPPSTSFAPLTYGACLAWCADRNRDLDVAAALDRFVFEDAHGGLGAAVLRAADVYRQSGAEAFNGSPFFYALVGKDASLGGGSAVSAEGIEHVLAELREADRAIVASDPQCGDGDLIKRELHQAIRLTRLGAHLLARKHGLDAVDTQIDRDEIAAAIAEQRVCWLARSREGGLEDSIGKLRLPPE